MAGTGSLKKAGTKSGDRFTRCGDRFGNSKIVLAAVREI